ncbi:MAG: glycosyltransferase family 2 protein [Pyrinomonadaceae bacterium]
MKARDNDTPRCTYLLPIRRVRVDQAEMCMFASYFRSLTEAGCEVLVVDGSPASVFGKHDDEWGEVCRHVTTDPKYTYLNGKVNGVHTGVDLASSERIILADDDIRYTHGDIDRMCDLLDKFEMVRPQNFLSPLPWWARLEAARMLMNRGALRAGDYPGTCGFRRSTMRRVGPYDGDVLFDNEEIVRHFALKGAHINYALDFFLLKRPPTFAKWVEQRPRQAYEDFVMRLKTAAFLSVLPAVCLTLLFAGSQAAFYLALSISLCAMLVTLRGLLRDSAYRFFPTTSLLSAPLWVLDRSLSVYWAVYWRLRYGGYPFGPRLLSKGTGEAWVAGGRIQSRALADRSGVGVLTRHEHV